MYFQFSYTLEQNIKSLSERLKYFARNTNRNENPNKQNAKSENLTYNLSLLFSHIILNLSFIDRSKDVFLGIIQEYNIENKTQLSFENFESIFWIREVQGDIVMPGLVRNYLWQVGHDENEGRQANIPLGKNDLTRCLQIYSERCFENPKPLISREKLEDILTEFAKPDITIDYLIQKGVITVNSAEDYYYHSRNQFSEHLQSEIVSTLWILLGGNNMSDLKFKEFFRLIERAELFPYNLGAYLNINNVSRICALAASYLNAENDLLKSDTEYEKMSFDDYTYRDKNINREKPRIEFNYDSTFDFIESVSFHKFAHHDIYDYQRVRSFCYILLKLIIDNDPKHPKPYQNVIRILKDTSRPFLVWTLYKDISEEFPEIIPYLLTDFELIPIAFKQVDNVKVDNSFLSEQNDNDKQYEQSCQLKNKLSIEMFDLVLEQCVLTHTQFKEVGKILGQVLMGEAEKVFAINPNSSRNSISHTSIRSRYNDFINKFSNKRITAGNSNSVLKIYPRLALYVLPEVYNYIKEKKAKEIPSQTGFLRINSGFLDLSIAILRIANSNIPETEILKEQSERIKKVSEELVLLVKNHIINFFSVNEITLQAYLPGDQEKRKPIRGVNEFGFEIVDWGYLFLHFQKAKVLRSINESFKNSLDFNTQSDKYDDQNKEQSEKLKLYLKSLMLAFISINGKRDLYEIEGFSVKETLAELESLIKDYSLTYSTDNLLEKRIDVFSQIFIVNGNDIYYQSLPMLLYKSINFFKDENQNNFVEEFFSTSIDVGRMLTAINILDSKGLRDIIAKRINDVNIEDFIKTSFTITELENALVEAVNSENHWELAKPLIEKIQAHFKRMTHFNQNTSNFLLEINLLLAFKEKDFEKMTKMAVPKVEGGYTNLNQQAENKKRFFIALFNLYNDKKYDEAIKILKSLLSNETKNIRYAFHLYRAQTLKAIETE